VHGDARIFVSMEVLPSPVPGAQDMILMWNVCKRCHQITPIVPMSEETWKYSTGKFLEISFHNAEPFCRSETCNHKLHRDHVRCFGLQGYVIKMEYEQVSLLEIMVPQMRIQVCVSSLSAFLLLPSPLLKAHLFLLLLLLFLPSL